MAIGGHHSPTSKSVDWLTPPRIIGALGKFDLDPACPPNMPWRTATVMLTPEDDGLAHDWSVFPRVWLNPPYGQAEVQGPWLRKLVEHGRGTALIFARTETELFFECVWSKATAILFLEGRLFFHYGWPHHDTKSGRTYAVGDRAAHNSGAPSVLVAYGGADAAALHRSGLPGRYVPLFVTTQVKAAA
jgi:hypothetical protein